MHTILDVVVGDQTTAHPSVLKDFQQHPVSGRILHIDLQEVRLDQPITVSVSVHLLGESPGAKEGGILSQQIREVSVEALPMEMPEHLELDISELRMGDSLRLADIAADRGRDLPRRPDTVLVTVSAPRALEVEEAVERRGRGGRGRSPRARLRPRARPSPPRSRCGSSVGASRPRHSTCSSRGSATRAASTSATATTPAGWSSTSWRGGTAPRSAASSRAASPRRASPSGGSRCSSRRPT